MKMTQSVRWLAALALSIPALAQAADESAKKPTPPPLISLDDLQKRLGDPHLRLLDVRAEAKYKQGQLPGAVWVDVKVFQPLLKPDSITSKEAWASGLASLGIDDQAEVYVYDDDRQHIAGKVWWLLSYAGVSRVGLIDGGYPVWEREKRPITTEVAAVKPHELPVHFHARRAATREDVQSAIRDENIQIIDARSAAEYRGEKKSQNGARGGHIPSARPLDLYDLVDQDGRFLSGDEQRKRLSKAGIVADRPIIVYSQAGSRSGGVVFALRRLGIPARHYVAGLKEWTIDPNAPLVEGEEATPRAE